MSTGEGSGKLPGKGRIWVSAEKVEIRTSNREGSWQVSGKGRIRASDKKVEIRASTGNVGSGRVPKKGSGEYQKGGIPVSTGEGSG